MYAVCVIWPFKLNPTFGAAIGGLAAANILIQYLVGLARRQRLSPSH